LNICKNQINRRLIFLKVALLVVLSQLIFPNLYAGEEVSALVAYDAFVENANRVIVGAVGFSGKPQPEQWLLLCQDEKNSGQYLELVVKNGKVVAQRKVSRLPGQDLPDIPLSRGKLRVDSTDARGIALEEAKQLGLSFETVHYQLRCRDARGEAVWLLSLRNSASVEIGKIYLSAESGKVLRRVGLKPARPIQSSFSSVNG
jgi:hypothetical protein